MNDLGNNITQRALERLEEQTSAKVEYTAHHTRFMNTDIDGEVNLVFKGKNTHLFVEVKKELKPYHLPRVIELANKYDLMVIAERIYPAQREALRKHGIAYLDVTGNMFIDKNNVLLWLDGNKPIEINKPVTNRAFTKTGLKTVFQFLIDEDTLNLPYRAVAQTTNAALGNIKYIIEGLQEAGYILPMAAKKKVLKNKKELLHRWIAGYQETLKPALHLGDFNFWNKDLFETWQKLPRDNKIAWGGEAAAELLTNYLNPANLTIYIDQVATLNTQWQLIPKKEGRLKIYKRFWTDADWDAKNLTPPLLTYADLMITNDPRCLETAKIIYEKYIQHEFEKR